VSQYYIYYSLLSIWQRKEGKMETLVDCLVPDICHVCSRINNEISCHTIHFQLPCNFTLVFHIFWWSCLSWLSAKGCWREIWNLFGMPRFTFCNILYMKQSFMFVKLHGNWKCIVWQDISLFMREQTWQISGTRQSTRVSILPSFLCHNRR
jgi:hypothetical protein